jgi:xanthine dehydrogenase accessory factor
MLPAPLLQVNGHTPVADALVAIAEVLGYSTTRSAPGALSEAAPEQATALIVASHGRDEQGSIRTALDAGVGYIALVASRRRGEAVLDGLGLTDTERARISTPAGLDIGARTAAEIAVSILAEVIAKVRNRPVPSSNSESALVAEAKSAMPMQTIDPVCGMTVTVMPDTPHLVVDGEDVWFCNPGCRDRHAETVRS